jgi:hypothetical protein
MITERYIASYSIFLVTALAMIVVWERSGNQRFIWAAAHPPASIERAIYSKSFQLIAETILIVLQSRALAAVQWFSISWGQQSDTASDAACMCGTSRRNKDGKRAHMRPLIEPVEILLEDAQRSRSDTNWLKVYIAGESVGFTADFDPS